MALILQAPGDLQPEEWNQVFGAIGRHPLKEPLIKLFENGNVPMAARDIFDKALVHSLGQEYINGRFRSQRIPFRLTRIGTWMCEESRGSRMLALVPWPYVGK